MRTSVRLRRLPSGGANQHISSIMVQTPKGTNQIPCPCIKPGDHFFSLTHHAQSQANCRRYAVSSRLRQYLFLLLLTVAALFVHGYHPATEDAEIYIPGIKKLLYPALYPFGTEVS